MEYEKYEYNVIFNKTNQSIIKGKIIISNLLFNKEIILKLLLDLLLKKKSLLFTSHKFYFQFRFYKNKYIFIIYNVFVFSDILQKLTLANFNKLCKLLEKPQHIFRSDTFNQGNPIQLICRQCNFNGILLQLFYDNEHHEMLIPSMWYQGDTLYYITQFKNYDKYIVFWENPSNNNDSRYLDMAVLTDYLPLKNTGIAAIKFIENLRKYVSTYNTSKCILFFQYPGQKLCLHIVNEISHDTRMRKKNRNRK